MRYSILIEKLPDPTLPEDYYYAFIPALDLTTHGQGIEGARQAAIELAKIWVEEKKANGENLPLETESYLSSVDIYALQSA